MQPKANDVHHRRHSDDDPWKEGIVGPYCLGQKRAKNVNNSTATSRWTLNDGVLAIGDLDDAHSGHRHSEGHFHHLGRVHHIRRWHSSPANDVDDGGIEAKFDDVVIEMHYHCWKWEFIF